MSEMSIDEAIELFESDINYCKENYKCNEKYCAGMEMAIKALKFQNEHQQKVQRCIERINSYKNAATEMHYMSESGRGSEIYAYSRCVEIIKEEMGCK